MFEGRLGEFKYFYLFFCLGHLLPALEFNFLQTNLGGFGRGDFCDF